MKNMSSDFVLPRQNRRERLAQNSYNMGSWSRDERLLLLKGLQTFGVGKWKEIGTVVVTRDATQIKSYAQRLVKRMRQGENIFEELEPTEKEGINRQASPTRNQSPRHRLEEPASITKSTVSAHEAADTGSRNNEAITAASLLCQIKADNATYERR